MYHKILLSLDFLKSLICVKTILSLQAVQKQVIYLIGTWAMAYQLLVRKERKVLYK